MKPKIWIAYLLARVLPGIVCLAAGGCIRESLPPCP